MALYKMKMPVNPGLMTKVLTKHKNTFYALKELINNSLYAKAKRISIRLVPSACDPDSAMYKPIEHIEVEDTGYGVPFSEFHESIMEIANNNKPEGKGVGRFAALQMGRKMTITTVGLEKATNKRMLTSVTFTVRDFEGKNISEKDFEIQSEETTLPQGYKVVIEDLYDYDPVASIRNKLGKTFRDTEILKEKLFKSYLMQIFRGKVVFDINGDELNKEDFFVERPQKFFLKIKDGFGKEHDLTLNFFSVKLTPAQCRVFFTQHGADTPIAEYSYNSPWYDPISMGSQFVYVQSDLITEELYSNGGLEDLGAKDWKNVTDAVRDGIDTHFKTDFKKISSFVNRLHEDRNCYPFDETEEGINREVFDRTAFLIEEDLKLQEKDDATRSLIYNLMRQVIENGDTQFLMQHLTSLTKSSREQLIELLDNARLDSVLRFSSAVANKKRAVSVINDLVYSEEQLISERKLLTSYIEKNLWMFGRQYENLSPLLQSQEHYKLIEELHAAYFDYKPKANDKNLRENIKKSVASLENGFIYRELPLGADKTEILMIEVLSPGFQLSKKETDALDNLGVEIKKNAKYPKGRYCYKIILLTPDFDEIQSTYLSNKKEDNYFYKDIPGFNINMHIIKWSEFIDDILTGLNFMSQSLELREKSVSLVLDKEYNGLIQMPKKPMYQKKVNEISDQVQ